MRSTRAFGPVHLFPILFLLAACGGGGSTVSGFVPPVVLPPPPPTPPEGVNAGGVGAPLDPLAKFGTTFTFSPTPHQGLEILRAQPSGGLPEANPQLTLQRTTTGFDLRPSDLLTGVPYDTRAGGFGNRGVNQYESCPGGSCAGSGVGRSTYLTVLDSGAASTLTYSTYGRWTRTVIFGVEHFAVFATGLPSTAAQIPTTGSATYTGGASGYVASGFVNPQLDFKGTSTFNANFGARTISGTVTNITTNRLNGTDHPGTLGNIVLGSTSIVATGFTGASAGVAAAGSAVNLAGATGQYGGVFYGPNGQEVAGSFTLLGTGFTVIGSFGAKR